MNSSFCPRRRRSHRNGVTIVEVAVVLPVFFAFIFGLVEYGRIQLVSNLVDAACRTGARYGSTDGVTTAEAKQRVLQVLSAAIDADDVTVLVKNAGVYDTGDTLPASMADYQALPDIELSTSEPRQLFVVRASVAYNDVALAPFSVLEGMYLTGQTFMRHE